jgi:hypothetical protein
MRLEGSSSSVVEAVLEGMPLDDEERAAARVMLVEEGQGVAEAPAGGELAGLKPASGIWKWVLMVGAVVLALVLGAIHGTELLRGYSLVGNSYVVRNAPEFVQRFRPAPIQGLSERQQLLISDRLDWNAGNLRRLIELDPDDPAVFSAYASAYSSEFDKMPEGYLETARRLAPDNAWFLFRAAGKVRYGAVERKRYSREQRLAGERREYDIKDPAALETAIELFRKGVKLEVFDNYESRLRSEAAAILPAESAVEVLRRTINGVSWSTGIFQIRQLSDLLAAEGRRLEAAGDVEGLRTHLGDCERFLRMLDQQAPDTLIFELVYQVVAAGLSEFLAGSAEALGLEEEAATWERRSEGLRLRNEARRNRSRPSAFPDVEKFGGLLAQTLPMLGNQVEQPPMFTVEDLGPSRRVEHALVARAAMIAGCLLAGLGMILPAVARMGRKRWLRRLSGRMEGLLRPVDWCWILGLGVVLPLGAIWAWQVASPWGRWSVGVTEERSVFYPYLAMVLLCVTSVVLMADLRVRSRLAAFAMPRRSLIQIGWWGLLPIGLAVTVFLGIAPGMPQVATFDDWLDNKTGEEITMLDLLMGFWFCLLLGLFAAGWYERGKNLLCRMVVGRVLPVGLAFLMLLMAASLPVLKWHEKECLKQDTLMFAKGSESLWSSYELKVAAQVREELRELLWGNGE